MWRFSHSLDLIYEPVRDSFPDEVVFFYAHNSYSFIISSFWKPKIELACNKTFILWQVLQKVISDVTDLTGKGFPKRRWQIWRRKFNCEVKRYLENHVICVNYDLTPVTQAQNFSLNNLGVGKRCFVWNFGTRSKLMQCRNRNARSVTVKSSQTPTNC